MRTVRTPAPTIAADVHGLTGAYALDALSPDERELFEGHLDACPACAQEVAELRATAARLASATAMPPGRHLRDRVFAEVATTRQYPPHVVIAEVIPLRRKGKQIIAAVAAVAAAVAMVVGGIALTRPAAPAAPVAAPPEITSTVLTPGGASAVAEVSRSAGTIVVTVRDLPDPGPGRVYQVWLIGAGGPRSAGVLPSGETASVRSALPADADHIGITTEPAGGSPRPTTAGVLRIDLA